MILEDYNYYEREFVESLLREIPAHDYDTWIKIGMALKDGGFPIELWEAWSQIAGNYEPGACTERWKSFNKNDGFTLDTLFHLAKQNGWTMPIIQPVPITRLEPIVLTEPHILTAKFSFYGN